MSDNAPLSTKAGAGGKITRKNFTYFSNEVKPNSRNAHALQHMQSMPEPRAQLSTSNSRSNLFINPNSQNNSNHRSPNSRNYSNLYFGGTGGDVKNMGAGGTSSKVHVNIRGPVTATHVASSKKPAMFKPMPSDRVGEGSPPQNSPKVKLQSQNNFKSRNFMAQCMSQEAKKQ